MAHRAKLTLKKRAEFLEELEKDANATRAAEAVGISRPALYRLRDRLPKFKEQWDKAVHIGDHQLVDEAKKRALGGSDVLLMFLIKARHPEYRDKFIDMPSGAKFSLSMEFGGEPKEVKGHIQAESLPGTPGGPALEIETGDDE